MASRSGQTMLKYSVAFVVIPLGLGTGTAFAQQCLHGANETTDQATRRREALTATRTVNNIQFNRPGAPNRQFFRHEELARSPYALRTGEAASETVKRMSLSPETEILPGCKLILDVTQNDYRFMIKDTTDPCGFSPRCTRPARVVVRPAAGERER